jgi:DNA replication licensing factor MCM6
MDIASAATGDANLVVDTVGNRCQKLFQDFLEEWQEGDELKYLKQVSISCNSFCRNLRTELQK